MYADPSAFVAERKGRETPTLKITDSDPRLGKVFTFFSTFSFYGSCFVVVFLLVLAKRSVACVEAL